MRVATGREDFLATLNKLRLPFDAGCYSASICLCGKVLEVCLREILQRHGVQIDPSAPVGSLLGSIGKLAPAEYLDPTLNNLANIIETSRNKAAHPSEGIPIPSRDETIMVIFATRDVVRRSIRRQV